MQVNRAIDIYKSKGNIGVFLNKQPVWINSIDEKTKSAKITYVGTNNEQQVSITDLTEDLL